jgi:hypothetical protein
MRYSLTGGARSAQPTVTEHHWHFLWGLVGDDSVNVVCPNGRPTPARVESHLQGWTFLTLGLVSLTSVDVYCI